MNQKEFLQTQVVDLRRLAEDAADDPILSMQLQERLEDADSQLKAHTTDGTLFPPETPETPETPRAAIFLKGDAVQGQESIRAGLAGEALQHYERMFVAQAIHDEREAARTAGRQRRSRGAAVPALLLTGTPRGSFGLEFTPELQEDETVLDVHRASLENVAKAIIMAADTETPEDLSDAIPTTVIQPLTRLFQTLARHNAELRLAFPAKASRVIGAETIKTASERLARTIEQNDVRFTGKFRGLTRETGYFDFVRDDDTLITGFASDELTEEDLERIDKLTNLSCRVMLQETRVQRAGKTQTSYLLRDAELLPEG
ncbi:MAG: hypothetical protein ABJZ55_07535 [Fuerstiella sp.]